MIERVTRGLRESACDPNGGVGGVAFYSSTNNTNRSSWKPEGIEYCIVISFEQLIIDPLVNEKKTENRNLSTILGLLVSPTLKSTTRA